MSFLPIIGDLIESATNLIGKYVPDKTKAMELEHEIKKIKLQAENKILEVEHTERLAQVALNTEEAKSKSLFIAGWRPAVGWVCVVGLAYAWVIKHLLIFGLSVASMWYDKAADVIKLLPTLSVGEITGLLIPLLGLGVYRTVEKIKGVANK